MYPRIDVYLFELTTNRVNDHVLFRKHKITKDSYVFPDQEDSNSARIISYERTRCILILLLHDPWTGTFTFHLSLYPSIWRASTAAMYICCLVNTSVVVRYASIQPFIRVPRFWQWSQLVYNRDAMRNDNRTTHRWQFTLQKCYDARIVIANMRSMSCAKIQLSDIHLCFWRGTCYG